VTAELELRPVDAEERPAFAAALRAAFHHVIGPEEGEVERAVFEPARSLAVFDADAIVATANAYTRELTVPGGPVPVAAVSYVGVRPTHRRRGLLSRMMRRQLAEVHEAGREAVAALWASEGRIYGRFGYAPATRAATLTARPRDARVGGEIGLPPAHAPAVADARPALDAVHEAVRRAWPGMLDRRGAWWDVRLDDRESAREGAGPLTAVVQPGPGGEPAGYAIYAVKEGWRDGRPAAQVHVRELLATTPPARSALWRYLLDLDLIESLTWAAAPPDEPVWLMLDDPTAARTALGAALWVRLVDVGRALAERTYAAPLDVVLDVRDDPCPWNARRFRLSAGEDGAATCAATTDAPDLTLGAPELGAAHLGGVTLAALAAAGRVAEHRAGALRAASLAFRGEAEPWCPDGF
jgi:predicted acetyltransferase